MKKIATYLCKKDSVLNEIIHANEDPMLLPSETIFEDLVSCILDMQIRFRGKAVRYKRMKHLLDQAPISTKNIFSIGDEGLAYINMSKQKYEALLSLTSFWEEQGLDQINWNDMATDAIYGLLSQVKGIGTWTIDMVMLYSIGKEDVFPVDDFHLKRTMSALYGINDDKNIKKEMQHIAESWRPFRSLGVLYLLNAAKTPSAP